MVGTLSEDSVAVQGLPLGPNKPCVQVQSVAWSLAPSESELEGHGMQEELPGTDLNVP